MKIQIPFQFMFSVALRFSTVLSGLIIFLISSFLYGPKGRGDVAFVSSFYLALSLFLSFGMGRIMYKHLAQKTHTIPDIQRTAMRFVNFATLAVLIGLGTIFILSSWDFIAVDESELLQFVLFMGFFPYALWGQYSNYLYSATQQTNVHDKVIFATRLGQSLILLVAIPLHLNILGFLGFYGFSSLIVYWVELLGLGDLEKSHKLSYQQSWTIFKDLFKTSKWAYLEAVAIGMTTAVPYFLGLFVTKSALGNYSFAIQILWTLWFPFLIMQVKLQELLAHATDEQAKTIVKKNISTVLLGSGAIVVFVFFIPIIIRLTGFAHFDEAMPILKAMSLTVPIVGIQMCLQGVWVATHRVKFSAILNLLMGVVVLAGTIGLAPFFGIWAGVYSFYFGYSLNIFVGMLYLKNLWRGQMIRTSVG